MRGPTDSDSRACLEFGVYTPNLDIECGVWSVEFVAPIRCCAPGQALGGMPSREVSRFLNLWLRRFLRCASGHACMRRAFATSGGRVHARFLALAAAGLHATTDTINILRCNEKQAYDAARSRFKQALYLLIHVAEADIDRSIPRVWGTAAEPGVPPFVASARSYISGDA